MSIDLLAFNVSQFNRLFPFYFLVDRDLTIISVGKSLEKICPYFLNSSFLTSMQLKRPSLIISSFADLGSLQNQLIVIETNMGELTLRGQFELLDTGSQYLFVGTPWFHSMDQIRALKLNLHDFSFHDPMIDLLHVLKTQEITRDEIKELLVTVNAQQKKLKRSEENYRNIVEKATDIIYKANHEGYFVYVNEVAERITGYTREELMSMRYLELISPDYQQKASDFYHKQLTKKITTTYFEFPILSKEGKEIWIGQSVQFPQSEDTDTELTALAIDITERKYAEQNLVLQEEKYRNIIANMHLGLLEVDKNEIIQYANQSFCSMSGYTLNELIGSRTNILLLHDSDEEIIKEKKEVRKDGVSDMYSLPVRNRKGEKRWWMISGAPRYNDKGEHVGSVGIHLDVTDQKIMEEQLRKAKLKAEDSSKAKESFLATMSHEIRTPLNAIIGITDLMNMNTNARNNENLEILSFSAKNLLALISDILDLSKIDAGKIELSANLLDLKQLIQGVYSTFCPSCEEKKLELILQIDKSVPELIFGDGLRLSQVLNNLISNAIKFTPKGYVKIKVESENIGESNVRVFFKIIDSGIGIIKSKIQTIFEAFEQADPSIIRDFGGTGLGLSITKKLIELQGGQIKVDSKFKRGSEFSFYIDYKIPPPDMKMQRLVSTSNDHSEKMLKDKRVLLVEDNLANQKVATSYLNHWGLSYEVANHGAEALMMLKEQKFDLALIDLYMPVMDGFETIKKIRKMNGLKSLPIIALTASAEPSLMERAISLGADKCLTKPFNAPQLRETILGLLKQESHPPEKTKPKREGGGRNKYTYIDLRNIKAASLGSDVFIREMLVLLIDEIPPLIEKSDVLLQAADYEQFSSLIHKMKNSLLMLGMQIVNHDLCLMEDYSKDRIKIKEIKQSFKRLKAIWLLALPELIDALANVQKQIK